MKIGLTLFALATFAGLAGCAREDAKSEAPAAAAPVVDAGAILDEVIAGPQRLDEERARDAFRHPRETLLFFGAEPSMAVVEIWPGGGWYSNIIAPFLARGGGVYYAAGLDPKSNSRAEEAVGAFAEKFTSDPATYGTVRLTVLGGDEPIAPEGSADLVLTFRNVHNWMMRGDAEDNFKAFYAALKPGGVLGVVEHRAADDIDADKESTSGYVRVATVMALAEEAGFEFEASSEINANPLDTKDHPFGVWTLPPVRRSSAVRGVDDPDFDRTKYDAIGESDRMTLKFRKPLAADGALLQ